jgi:ABC-type nitrate/sulfonate/bicarbonate transport system substrate-binding protein
MKRRHFVAAASGLAAGAALPNAAWAQATHLDIGTSTDPQNGGLLIVAKRLEFFSKNGVDVTLKYFPSAGDMVSAMAGGALFMGTGATVPTSTLRAGGFPVVVIAQQADISGAQEVVCNKEIKTPQDFEGKKVGALFGTTPQMLAEAMWQHYHIPPDKVTMANLGPADMVTALLRGDIAGAVLWEPWCTQAVAGGAHRLLSGTYSYVPGQSGPSRIIGVHSVLVAPKPWVDKNSPIVSAVLKSLIAAGQFIASDPQKAAEEVGVELKFPASEMRDMMARNIYSVKIDPRLISDMRVEAAFLYKNGKLKSPVKPEDWVYPGPLSKVDPAMVSWTPPR